MVYHSMLTTRNSTKFSLLADTAGLLSLSTLEDVDLEIQRVSEYQQALRIHRNTFIPISKLPADVLQLIFGLCAPRPYMGFCRLDLAFSQTCRLWRMHALSNPSLWRAPVFVRPRLALEMLARAADYTLILKVSPLLVPATIYHVMMDTLGSRSLERLDATADRDGLENLTRLTMARSQRTLTHLRLEYRDSTDAAMNGLEDYLVLLRDAAGDALFPHLRDLRLVCCMMPLIPQSFSNLTALEIDLSYSNIPTYGVKIPSLISILHQSPDLEELSLLEVGKCVDSDLPTATSATHQMHTFARLKRLNLRESQLPTLMILLNALNCPILSELEIYIEEPGHLPDSLEKIHQFLRCLVKKLLLGHQVQTFSYHVDYSDIRFMARGTSTGCANLSLRLGLGDIKTYDLLHELPLSFSLTGLNSCMVNTRDIVLAHQLHPLWAHLGTSTSVVEIRALGDAYLGLQYVIERTTYAPSSQPIFHSLKTVSIEEADMTSYGLRGSYGMTGLRRFALFLKHLQDKGRTVPNITFNLFECRVLTAASEVFEKFGILKLPTIESEYWHSDPLRDFDQFDLEFQQPDPNPNPNPNTQPNERETQGMEEDGYQQVRLIGDLEDV